MHMAVPLLTFRCIVLACHWFRIIFLVLLPAVRPSNVLRTVHDKAYRAAVALSLRVLVPDADV